MAAMFQLVAKGPVRPAPDRHDGFHDARCARQSHPELKEGLIPKVGLAPRCGARILREMFIVSEEAAAAIRAIFDEHGGAFGRHRTAPAVSGTIASWTPLPVPTLTRRRRNEWPGVPAEA